ncbi:MAG: ABC transporter ATP-binding protein [Brevinema sp.]
MLDIRNLSIRYSESTKPAVDNVSFSITPHGRTAIAGESGSGKSSLALAMMGLLSPKTQCTGEIIYQGQNLLQLHEKELENIRGKEISMIFQEPMTALNPVFTAGEQIEETLQAHESLSKAQTRTRMLDMLTLTGFKDPTHTATLYPHELSGGMRQRVMIAMALACRPKILIADEPTTALDVTIQAQILELIKNLQQELGMALVLITHDLGVVVETSQELFVMYAGKIVEKITIPHLLDGKSRHPYTAALLDSAENMNPIVPPIPLPEFAQAQIMCAFAPRCFKAQKKCFIDTPDPCFYPLGETHESTRN